MSGGDDIHSIPTILFFTHIVGKCWMEESESFQKILANYHRDSSGRGYEIRILYFFVYENPSFLKMRSTASRTLVVTCVGS